VRDVLIFYSPDDIFSNITWNYIGYPDDGLFLLHRAFPQLKCTIQTVAENRYLGGIPNRNIEADPVAREVWTSLFSREGGIVDLFDHWWEHSQPRAGGVRYRFELLKELLSRLEAEYGSRIWWGFGSEMARWSELTRTVPVSIRQVHSDPEISFGAPRKWKTAWAMGVAYTIAYSGPGHLSAVRRMYYTLDSEGHAAEHPLEAVDYWIEGDALRFAFPFSDPAKVLVDFAE
jgi:hypothetical protein